MRDHNTNLHGRPFDRATIDQVWNKGKIIQDFDPNVWRWDKSGKPIRYSEYGNTDSKYGWEIDHINPVAKGGGDELNNLQPLQWYNNRLKSDSFPWP